MRSFKCALAALLVCASASGQTPATGFAVDRFYPSAPGGGWFLMDALDWNGGWGGAMSFSLGYAHNPSPPAVTDLAINSIAAAVSYQRWRLSLNLDAPLWLAGTGDGAPAIRLGSNPDTLSDPRLGIEARLFGTPGSNLRLGAGAQLFIPNGNRTDYDTDGTFRAIGRFLAAGDVGSFGYAGNLGFHVRPAGPQGSELLFGAAGGVKQALTEKWAAVVGPEIHGATAFQAFFRSSSTAIEALLGFRIEQSPTGQRARLRIKAGLGTSFYARFGAPEWRVVLAAEIFNDGA